jgi:hypothetical protein
VAFTRQCGVEAGAVVAHLEPQRAGTVPDGHAHPCPVACVLAGVLHGLEAAEVDGGLQIGVMAAHPGGLDRGGQRRPVRCRLEGVGQPPIA